MNGTVEDVPLLPSLRKLHPALRWGCAALAAGTVVMWVGGVLLASVPGRRLHVRGELDRTHWVVRDCDSGESFRVIMASGQAGHFFDLERDLHVGDAEPLIIEFDGEVMSTRMPWDTHETVGIHGPIQLERGTCSR